MVIKFTGKEKTTKIASWLSAKLGTVANYLKQKQLA